MGFTLSVILVVVGIAALGFGADILVRGAVTLARAIHIPTAVIGLTIVSMGTSLPELTVSVSASLRGAADLSLSNVVGSNLFNVGIVLGATALVLPMRVHGAAVKLEWPFMFAASFILLLLARDGTLDRLEGGFFVVSLVLFTWYAVIIGRDTIGPEETAEIAGEVQRRAPRSAIRTIGGALSMLAAGVVVLVIGGEMLVRGAIDIARHFGMTERLIGLTVVAMGTGAPEAATSIVAARRGHSEIALGNVIGSNIFNVLGILGVAALLSPLNVAPQIITSDLWWMLGLSLALFPMMRTGFRVGRIEGSALILAYGTYLTLLAFGR
jgi:cation:H+ antiporter